MQHACLLAPAEALFLLSSNFSSVEYLEADALGDCQRKDADASAFRASSYGVLPSALLSSAIFFLASLLAPLVSSLAMSPTQLLVFLTVSIVLVAGAWLSLYAFTLFVR